MHLYITYKRYSSWSLRPWLVMKENGIPFEETLLPFAHNDSLSKFAEEHRVPATVPVLVHEDRVIWDSLAIMEYLAELYPDNHLWPLDSALRAMARSACAEMHSGFVALRTEHPMNCHRTQAMTPSPAVQADLDRLADIWSMFADAHKPEGDFLCGKFGIIDGMLAPIVWRARGYQLTISDEFDRWSDAVTALPSMWQWLEEGAAEEWRVEATEQVA